MRESANTWKCNDVHIYKHELWCESEYEQMRYYVLKKKCVQWKCCTITSVCDATAFIFVHTWAFWIVFIPFFIADAVLRMR